MDNAFKYAEGHPLMSEQDYPYNARNGQCHYNQSEGVSKVRGIDDVPQRSASQLKAALAKGPVSVAIEADRSVFKFYHNGIITSSSCGT